MIKKILWSLVLVTFIVSFAFIASYEKKVDAASKKAVGTVKVVSGKVYYGQKGKKASYAKKGTELYQNDIILTKDGKCVVVLKNGSQIRMGKDSKVVMNLAIASKMNSTNSAGIISGTVHVIASSGTNINTPSSVAGVRGTEFLIGVAATGSSNVMVLEGSVEVVGSKPKSTSSNNRFVIGVNEQASNDVVSEPKKSKIVEDSSKSKLSVSDTRESMVEFKGKEEKELEENPIAVLQNMADKMDQVDETTDVAIQEVKVITEEIKEASSSDEGKISKKEMAQLQKADEIVQSTKNQNVAIADLAKNVAVQHPSQQAEKTVKQVQQKHEKVNKKQNALDKFIDDMEKEMDAFISSHESELDKMAGFEDDGMDMNSGFEDFDMDNFD